MVLMTIPLGRCPAIECEAHQRGVSPIYKTDEPELFDALEHASHGEPYDYYHCRGWCKRIWRIRRYVAGAELYSEPQYVGSWDEMAAGATPVIFDAPRQVGIIWQYRRSKSDPTRPARSKKDAAR